MIAFSWLDLKITELHLGIHFCSLEIYAVEVLVTEFAGLCIYVYIMATLSQFT